MDLTRRSFVGALPLVLGGAGRRPAPSLAEDVATYVGFGEHRVGTAGERKTARWLERRLRGLGYAAQRMAVPVETILDPGGNLAFGDQQVQAFPQWYPPAGSLDRVISGALQPLATDSNEPSIRVVSVAARSQGNWIKQLDALVQEAAAKRTQALIMAIENPSTDLFVCNQHSERPFPIPVALIAPRQLPKVASAAERGIRASLRLRGKQTSTRGQTVIGERAGLGKMLVVSTPLTGWFTCGGERGPGIALWLRMARMLARSTRPVLLLGTAAHEIAHRGMEQALAELGPKPEDVALWLHFGASIAATATDRNYGVTSPQFVIGMPQTEAMAQRALVPVMRGYATGTPAAAGEAGQIIGAGHQRFVGLIGSFPQFHTPGDTGGAIDFARLEMVALAAEDLLSRAAA